MLSQNSPTMDVRADDGRSVSIARSFAAPRHVVWQAFTDATILANWLSGPPGWTMDVCQISLEPGGGYRWRWRDPSTGEGLGFRGTYTVVDPGVRLIDKQVFDQDGPVLSAKAATKNTVLFHDDGAGCRVTTTVRYPDAATCDLIVAQGLREGMEAAYTRLDKMLLRAAAA